MIWLVPNAVWTQLSVMLSATVGHALYRAGRVEEAEAQLRGVLAVDSSFILANSTLGMVHLIQGRATAALPYLQRAIDPKVRYSLDLALLYAQEGRTGALKRLAVELIPAFESREVHREAVNNPSGLECVIVDETNGAQPKAFVVL